MASFLHCCMGMVDSREGTMTTNDLHQTLLEALEGGRGDRIAQHMLGWPPTGIRDSAAQFAASGNQAFMVTALDMVLIPYALTAPAVADPIASALWEFSIRRVLRGEMGVADTYLNAALRSADGRAAALGRLGRWEESLRWARETLRQLRPHQAHMEESGVVGTLIGLRLKEVEALFELTRYEEASAALASLAGVPMEAPQRIEQQRLKVAIGGVLEGPTQLPAEARVPGNEAHRETNAERHRELLGGGIRAFEESSGGTGLKPELSELLRKRIAEEAPRKLSDRDLLARSEAMIEALRGYVGGDEALLNMQSRLRRAGLSLLSARMRQDTAALGELATELATLVAWFEEQGHRSDGQTARWALGVCLTRRVRLGAEAQDPARAWSAAADMFLTLQRDLEKERAEIADRDRRAGVMARYQFLFPVMAEALYEAGRVPELLSAIEDSKGRWLADLLFDEEAASEHSAAAHALPALMEKAGAHYLSFLVDDEVTWSVLVCRDGSLHATRIALGREAIRQATRNASPRWWGTSGDPFAPPTPSPPELLAPLLASVAEQLREGRIHDGDHLVVSPDDLLHLVPFHYLHLGGTPLIEHLSTSRVHGAGVLLALLRREPPRCTKWSVITVPGREDGEATRAAFEALSAPGRECLKGREATLEAVAALPLRGRRVHFGTHGIHPVEGRTWADPNPYTGSGLLLAGPSGLPDVEKASADGRVEALLSPAELAARGIDLSGSIVTTQACVSGLSKKSIGGDALGLELALLRAGASAVVASHWSVSASGSAPFFRMLHGHLDEGLSLGEAWRRTVRESDLDRDVADAFSLGGDWR